MLSVSHPTVNQYVRALIDALEAAGELQVFHTTLSMGRRAVRIERSKVRLHPFPEVLRLIGHRLRQDWLIRHESGWASVDAVAQAFDRQVSKSLDGTASVYCYEDSAVFTFRAAARMGVMRYYELPIVYWPTAQKLLRQEAERYPEWEPTLLATRDSNAKLERKSC